MRLNRQWLLSLAVLIPLVSSSLSCGGGGGGSDSRDPEGAGPGTDSPSTSGVITETGASVNTSVLTSLVSHFKFTETTPATYINFLKYDFGTLSAWKDTTRQAAFARLAKLYDIDGVDSESLGKWLTDRITYVYPDDGKELEFAFVVPTENRVYEVSVDTTSGEGVAASNIGGGLYAIYLDQHPLGVDGLLLKFNSSYIPFLSPRTGVMQIGPNFFDQTDSLDTTDVARRGFRTVKSLYRLSVLFHEARHSDGNSVSQTLSFAHPNCPADGTVADEYVGLPACDDKANGAYNIGGQILSAMAGVCDGVCSQRELGVIESIQLDVLSRLLVDDTATNYGDPKPEPALIPIDTRSYQIIPE